MSWSRNTCGWRDGPPRMATWAQPAGASGIQVPVGRRMDVWERMTEGNAERSSAGRNRRWPWTFLTKGMRSLADRLMHPWRRKAAIARLTAGTAPRCVLFVCKGNLHRSPFAAGCLREALNTGKPETVRIASAGFVRPGRTPSEQTQRCARRYNVDLSLHRSQLVAALAVAEWDLVVVMDASYGQALKRRYRLAPERVMILGDLDPASTGTRTIAEPETSTEVLEASYARIERCTRVLAGLITAQRP